MFRFRGSYVALVTPFTSDGKVDFDALGELCEFQVQNGTDGIVVLGTTGESSTMSHEEDEEVVRCAISAVKGRVPIVAGAGSNSTETSLMKATAYDKLGADAVLLITPYYNKANERGMIRHFTDVADRLSIPVIAYNVPSRTGCALSVRAVEALAKHKNIAGIKEASGDMGYFMNIAHLASDEFALISGNDDITLPIMAAGGTGCISVLANVLPKETAQLVNACLDGNYAFARELQLKYLKLIRALFMEVNPIPVKTAMRLMGMRVGGFRMPLCDMDEVNEKRLEGVLKEYGLI